MRTIALIFIFLASATAVADIGKITNQDAENICTTMEQLYSLQNGALSTYPLAQVVHIDELTPASVTYSMGNADENVSCMIAQVGPALKKKTVYEAKIVYNPEVSTFQTNRAFSSWTVFKAYDIQGALAENICAQLETFNVTEDQAAIPPGEQVLFMMKDGAVENVFGLAQTVATDKYLTCGSIEGVKTLQFSSVGIW